LIFDLKKIEKLFTRLKKKSRHRKLLTVCLVDQIVKNNVKTLQKNSEEVMIRSIYQFGKNKKEKLCCGNREKINMAKNDKDLEKQRKLYMVEKYKYKLDKT